MPWILHCFEATLRPKYHKKMLQEWLEFLILSLGNLQYIHHYPSTIHLSIDEKYISTIHPPSTMYRYSMPALFWGHIPSFSTARYSLQHLNFRTARPCSVVPPSWLPGWGGNPFLKIVLFENSGQLLRMQENKVPNPKPTMENSDLTRPGPPKDCFLEGKSRKFQGGEILYFGQIFFF